MRGPRFFSRSGGRRLTEDELEAIPAPLREGASLWGRTEQSEEEPPEAEDFPGEQLSV